MIEIKNSEKRDSSSTAAREYSFDNRNILFILVSDCLSIVLPTFYTNLIALWRFDNNLNDDEGSYNGNAVGDYQYVSIGYIGSDISFEDTSSSYVQTSTIFLVPGNFTIELWMRIVTTPDGSMVLISQNDLVLRLSSNRVMTIVTTQPSSGTKLLLNMWYHIALVYIDSLEEQQIYVNGILDSTSSTPLLATTTDAFYIGALNGTSEFYTDEIDHLSVTNRAKSACEILRDASLVASYPFTQDVGAQSDSGPNGLNGVISASVTSIQTGVVGDALLFSGSAAYFQVFS
jgi:hypothetical protein